MGESIFTTDGGRFIPTEQARGPWDPQALHGGAPAALIVTALERHEPVCFHRAQALAPPHRTTHIGTDGPDSRLDR